MRLNRFEKYISNKVDEYPSALDTESLWMTLESDLEKKKKRRLAIILLLFLSALAIGYLIRNNFQTAQVEPAVPNTMAMENTEATNKDFQISSQNTNQTENENELTVLNPDSKKSAFSKKTMTENKKKTVPSIIKEKNKTVDQKETLIKHSTYSNSNTNSAKTITKPVAENDVNELKNQITKIEDIDKINLLDLTEINSVKKENELIINKNSLKIKPVKNWSLYISPSVGAHFTVRNISPKNENGETLKLLRNGAEKTLETLSMGIELELRNKNNFFLSGGINFNQMTERFNDQRSDFTIENIEIIKEINYLSNGERQEIIGMFEQSQEIISTTKIYNTLRWTEFNFGGGYYFTEKRWSLGASAGLLWGTMLNAEGKTLDAENNIVEIKNQSPAIYKNNLGLGAYANIEVSYALHPRWGISTQFGYKNMPASFTTENYPVEIKYQWIGASVGLRYKIF
ncbi:MAG: hypothetical protein AAFZ15_12235 [Bacteroidota bacterium]